MYGNARAFLLSGRNRRQWSGHS